MGGWRGAQNHHFTPVVYWVVYHLDYHMDYCVDYHMDYCVDYHMDYHRIRVGFI